MRRCGTRSYRSNRIRDPQCTRAFRQAGCAIVCAVLALLAAGCVTQARFDQIVEERDRLANQSRELESRVERLEATSQSLTAENLALIDSSEDRRIANNQLEADVARLSRTSAELAENLKSSQSLLTTRTSEIEKMRSTYDGLVTDLEDEVSAGQIQIERLRSGLQLNLSEEILFASGSAKLNRQGSEVLRKVGGRLIDLSNAIEVLGHTDDVPVRSRYPSNWELAAARASSVARLFVDLGIDPVRIKAVSRAEFEPVASNDTAEGRAKNRRIEIRLAASSSSPVDASKPSTETDSEALEEAGPEGQPNSRASELGGGEPEIPTESDVEPVPKS